MSGDVSQQIGVGLRADSDDHLIPLDEIHLSNRSVKGEWRKPTRLNENSALAFKVGTKHASVGGRRAFGGCVFTSLSV